MVKINSHSLAIQAKPPFSHKFTQLGPAVKITTETGQLKLVWGCKTESANSEIYVKDAGIADYHKEYGGIYEFNLESFRRTAVPKLYDMIMDKLYLSNFSPIVTFTSKEICDLTGAENQDRVMKRYLEAARLLRYFNGVWDTKLARIHMTLFSGLVESKIGGGFAISIDNIFLEYLKRAPKVQHDTVLYRLKERKDDCIYSFGRWIEDYSARHAKYYDNALKEVTFTVKAMMESCKFIPQIYTDTRNYSRRVLWLKRQLKELENVGFATFKLIDGTPANIEEEAKKRIKCVFKSERQALGPATRTAALPADDAPKRRGRPKRAALPADSKP